ncbi:proline iminopeptidase [Mycena floridula]|nr:proline iminopeptidase [Mycena floridula]
MSLNELSTVEGYLDFNYPSAGKPLQTWYRVIGDLSAGRPLVALHGGPGVNHAYLLILAELTKSHSIPLVVYDQIGNGNSTHLPEKMGDTDFFTEQLYLDELNNLLSQLGIKDNYDILGHSWGAMLGARHAAAQPKGLKHLVLQSGTAAMHLWMKEQAVLRRRLPQAVQDMMKKHEEKGTTESEEYEEAVGEFYANFLCRVKPMPDVVTEAFAWIKKDPTVYLTMNGPFEFEVIGNLKDWTIEQDAHRIKVPTLLLNGRYDEAQDIVVEPLFQAIPNVKWFTFPESSHMAHHEETARFMDIVGKFLTTN